jgi:fatty-acyl-CoA synthase
MSGKAGQSSSYVSGLATHPLVGETIAMALDRAAAAWPEQAAVVAREQGVRLSYAALRDRVEAVARGLIALGLAPGDRIGIWSPNNIEWVLTQFAAAKAGLILVSLNPAYRSSEIEYALRKVGCRAIICATSYKSSHYLEILAEVAPELKTSLPGALRAKSLPDLAIVIQIGSPAFPGAIPFEDLASHRGVASVSLVEVASKVSFDDPTNIQFTSGTTGAPKGATLTHHNILNNGYFVGEGIGLGAGDRVCIPVPFYHCFGMVMGNLACLTQP